MANGQRGLETVAVGAQSEHRLEFEPGAQCVCQYCGRNLDSYLSVRGQSPDACVKRVERPTRVLDIYADIPRGLMCCSGRVVELQKCESLARARSAAVNHRRRLPGSRAARVVIVTEGVSRTWQSGFCCSSI